MPDTKQRVRFVQVPAEHVAAFKSAPKNDDGVLYFLMGEIPELWFDNRRIAIDDNIAHTFMAQKLGTEDDSNYLIEYKNGQLEIKRSTDNNIISIALKEDDIIVRHIQGNPVSFAAVVQDGAPATNVEVTEEDIAGLHKYPLVLPASGCPVCADLNPRVNFLDNFNIAVLGKCYDVTYNSSLSGTPVVSLADFYYEVKYVNNIPSSLACVGGFFEVKEDGTVGGAAGGYDKGSWFDATNPLITSKTGNVNIDTLTDQVSFTPNNYHYFRFVKFGNRYYIVDDYVNAWNGKRYEYYEVENKSFTSGAWNGNGYYELDDSYSVCTVNSKALLDTSLIQELLGNGHLITTSNKMTTLSCSAWSAIWGGGSNSSYGVDFDRYGIFSPNIPTKGVVAYSDGSYKIPVQVNPEGSYNITKIEGSVPLVLNTGEQIRPYEVSVIGRRLYGNQESLVTVHGSYKNGMYIQFIYITTYRDSEGNDQTRPRLLFRTLVHGSTEDRWSTCTELLTTNDVLDIYECNNAVTWGTF